MERFRVEISLLAVAPSPREILPLRPSASLQGAGFVASRSCRLLPRRSKTLRLVRWRWTDGRTSGHWAQAPDPDATLCFSEKGDPSSLLRYVELEVLDVVLHLEVHRDGLELVVAIAIDHAPELRVGRVQGPLFGCSLLYLSGQCHAVLDPEVHEVPLDVLAGEVGALLPCGILHEMTIRADLDLGHAFSTST
jgi:hypothetical protein